MYKLKNTHERILHRLKIAKGHLEAVIKMVEANTYCIDVLHQSQAVQHALKKADTVILKNHLNTCASDAIKKGKQTKAVNEIMQVFEKMRV